MLKRKLLFYNWSPSGRADFQPAAAATRLEQGIANSADFSIVDNNGVITALEVISRGGGQEPTNFRMLALRGADDRPFKWDPTGSVGPIGLLDTEYPADVTHVSMWPDGICAHDYGRDVPRITRLSFFLRHKLSEHVSFEPIYKADMHQKLRDMTGQLRSVELAVTKPEYAPRDRGAFANLFPAAFGEEAPSARITLGMGRYGPRTRYLDQATEEEVFALAENAADLVTQMIIRGRSQRTGRVETVNLLSEHLQSESELRRSQAIPSMPDAAHAFFELDQAYKDFKSRDVFEKASQGRFVRGKKSID